MLFITENSQAYVTVSFRETSAKKENEFQNLKNEQHIFTNFSFSDTDCTVV